MKGSERNQPCSGCGLKLKRCRCREALAEREERRKRAEAEQLLTRLASRPIRRPISGAVLGIATIAGSRSRW